MDHPTERPTGIQSLLFLSMPQSFIIIPPPSNDNTDWPPDSVPSKGTTRSVRGSVNKKKKDGKKVDTFFGISVPITHGGLYQDGSVLRLVGGKKVVAVASSSGGSK